MKTRARIVWVLAGVGLLTGALASCSDVSSTNVCNNDCDTLEQCQEAATGPCGASYIALTVCRNQAMAGRSTVSSWPPTTNTCADVCGADLARFMACSPSYRVRPLIPQDGPPPSGPTSSSGSVDGSLGSDGPDWPVLLQPRAVAVASDATMVTTLAGGDVPGYVDGAGAGARFSSPTGIAIDSVGSLYVADANNHRIRKVTSAGVVTTLAGSGVAAFADGEGTLASFNGPKGVAVGASGDVFVADTENQRIRRVTPAGSVTTLAGSGNATFADGASSAASFYSPTGITVGPTGDIFVADRLNRRIRKVTPSGVVTTLPTPVTGDAGAGVFSLPAGVALDPAGNVVVADMGSNVIWRVSMTGTTTVLAGSFQGFADGASARFFMPSGVAVDSAGAVYVADTSNDRVRVLAAGAVTATLAGAGSPGVVDGTALVARLSAPRGVAVDGSGPVYVVDTGNSRVRKIVPHVPLPKGQLEVTWTTASGMTSTTQITYTVTASAPALPAGTCTVVRPTNAGSGMTWGCTLDGLVSGVAYSIRVDALMGYVKSAPVAALTGVPN